jgi:DNA polymerase III epsilon subunit family exonuclease
LAGARKRKSFEEARFVVLDFETTGLQPLLGDEVCEYAVAEIIGGAISRRRDELIDPRRSIPPEATAIHGIDDAMVRGRRGFESLFPELLEFIGDATLVVHNVEFDMGFLQARLLARGEPQLDNLAIDTLELSRSLRSTSEERHRLIDIAQRLGIEPTNLHRAAGDAEMTARIFLRLAEEVSRRIGAATLGDLGARRFRYSPRTSVGEMRAIASALAAAIDAGRSVEIVYDSRGPDGGPRRVDPQSLQAFHVAAYCHGRGTVLRFRIDRIRQVEILKDAALPQERRPAARLGPDGERTEPDVRAEGKEKPPGNRGLQGTEPPA